MSTPPSLPIIDLSPFLLPSSSSSSQSTPTSRHQIARAIHDACLSFGFFYITGLDSVVSAEEMDGSLVAARDFFSRPEEEKRALRIREGDGARGWQKLGSNVTQYKGEALSVMTGWLVRRLADPNPLSAITSGPSRRA